MYSDDIEVIDALKLYTRYDVEFTGYDYEMVSDVTRLVIGSADLDLFELIENTAKCNIIMDKEIRKNDIVF